MGRGLTFTLHDGRSAEVDAARARAIADVLWSYELKPGAAVAATRITEALRSGVVLHKDVQFGRRECACVLEASVPVAWSAAR
jgi:hypothetical protein